MSDKNRKRGESSGSKKKSSDSQQKTKRKRTTISFDVQDDSLNDVCLTVADRKFYCSKHHLAHHSDTFRSMFFGEYVEKDKKEITLREISSADDFESFLKVINAVKCLTDKNIEGVLQQADQWCAPVAQERCEDYLMTESKKAPKELFEIANNYTFLENLKEKLLSDVKTGKDFKELIEGIKNDMNPATTRMVLTKSLEFIPNPKNDPDVVVLQGPQPRPPVRMAFRAPPRPAVNPLPPPPPMQHIGHQAFLGIHERWDNYQPWAPNYPPPVVPAQGNPPPGIANHLPRRNRIPERIARAPSPSPSPSP